MPWAPAPSAGAGVMGTGIVSTALLLAGAAGPSRVLAWIAAAAWVVLALGALGRLAGDREALRRDAATPGALTAPAATCVLGTRLVLGGSTGAGAVALGVGAVLWALLLPAVLRARRSWHTGSVFLVTVSTAGLAVLCASVGLPEVALAPLLCALALYLLVLPVFDRRQLLDGAGDHWVAGGALAIAALAAGTIARDLGWMEPVAVAVWVAAMAWLPVLVAAELRRPRWRYDLRRWSTVFPLGMYAAMSVTIGRVADVGWMTAFGRAWAWVALAGWAVVATGMLRALARR